MALKSLIVLTTASLAFCQRPSFAGFRPIGYPELQTTSTTPKEDLGNRFGENNTISTTTQRLPVEANGDRDLVDRLSKLPIDKQPFWFINWQALEANRNNPQTYPLRPNQFAQPVAQLTNTAPNNNVRLGDGIPSETSVSVTNRNEPEPNPLRPSQFGADNQPTSNLGFNVDTGEANPSIYVDTNDQSEDTSLLEAQVPIAEDHIANKDTIKTEGSEPELSHESPGILSLLTEPHVTENARDMFSTEATSTELWTPATDISYNPLDYGTISSESNVPASTDSYTYFKNKFSTSVPLNVVNPYANVLFNSHSDFKNLYQPYVNTGGISSAHRLPSHHVAHLIYHKIPRPVDLRDNDDYYVDARHH